MIGEPDIIYWDDEAQKEKLIRDLDDSPFKKANPMLCGGRENVCVREFDGHDCACVIFDESRLFQLIGKTRSECSELVIGWVKESGLD